MGNECYIIADGLTAEDIRLLHRLAERMIAGGGWERVEYCATESAEIVKAYQAGLAEPVCAIGRQFGGLYIVDDYKSGRISLGTALILALDQHARVTPGEAMRSPA